MILEYLKIFPENLQIDTQGRKHEDVDSSDICLLFKGIDSLVNTATYKDKDVYYMSFRCMIISSTLY